MSLCFPQKILDQHLVVLGKTGAGKSSALRHIVENLLDRKKRVCIIDPKGDWNGLKVDADGKGHGYPVILFGDFKETAGKSIPADVPLGEHSGKHVAELVAGGNRPCVVGLRGWTQAAMYRFWIDFASTLFNSNGGEFYLVVDEVHNFAPKGQLGKGLPNENAATSLHWANRLINEGRGLGIVNLIASQRPQKVHNDTLDACETLVAMRMVHKAARDAVEDWLQGAGDKDRAREILNSLAGMDRGEAYVWSPEAKFGPKRLTFPMFKTFDSFAPPQLQKKVIGKDWTSVDLGEVREKLASVIEEAKKNDPAELRRTVEAQKKKINDLESKAAKVTVDPATKQSIRQLEKRDTELRRLLKEAVTFINKHGEGVSMAIEIQEQEIEEIVAGAVGKITKLVQGKLAAHHRDIASVKKEGERLVGRIGALLEATPATETHEAPNSQPAPPAPRRPLPRASNNGSGEQEDESGNGDGSLSTPQRALLIALAQHQDGLTKPQLLLHANYAMSGTMSKAFAFLIREELMESFEGGIQKITEKGLTTLGDYEPMPVGSSLRQYLLTGDKLNTPQKAVLKAICDAYPNAIMKTEILKAAGYAMSGTMSKAFARLVRYGYVAKTSTGLRANDALFD